MVLMRSKWSLRPAWRRRVGRPGVVGGADTTARRKPAHRLAVDHPGTLSRSPFPPWPVLRPTVPEES
jgi:hypothetical protein